MTESYEYATLSLLVIVIRGLNVIMSKNLFLNLLKEDFKRRLWVFTLSCLTFLLLIVMSTVIDISLNINTYNQALNAKKEPIETLIEVRNMEIAEDFSSLISNQNNVLGTFLLILALIVGISGFRYVQRKKSIAFFHGLPIRREKLFLVITVSSILMVALPYLVSLLIAAALVIVNTGNYSVLLMSMHSLAYYITLFAFAYMTVVLATLLTGNVVLAVFGSGLINFFLPIAERLASWYISDYFKTAYIDWGYVTQLIGNSSSFLFIYPISGLSDYEKILVALLGMAVFGIINLCVYKLRVSEATEKSISFDAVKIPTKIMVITILSLIVARIMDLSIGDSLGWSIFSIVISSLIAHCTIEAVYNSDFKKLFNNPLHLVICIAIPSLFFNIFYFDLIGYDRYIPPSDFLESGAVFSQVLEENILPYAETLKEVEDRTPSIYSEELTTKAIKRMKIKNKELFLRLAVKVVEEAKETDEYKSVFPNNEIILCYNLKGGGHELRRYNVSWDDVEEILTEIYVDEDYKKGAYPILDNDASDIVSFDYNYPDTPEGMLSLSKDRHVKIQDKKQVRKLVETYKNDLLKFTLEDKEKEYLVGTIRFNDEESERVLDEFIKENMLRNENDFNVDNASDVYEGKGYYPVYSGFESTLDMLRELQVQPELDVNTENIHSVSIYGDSDDKWTEETFYEPEEMKELIRIMLEEKTPYKIYSYNYNVVRKHIDVRIEMKDGTFMDGVFLIRELTLPDFVKERLSKYE